MVQSTVGWQLLDKVSAELTTPQVKDKSANLGVLILLEAL
jgi:hypothetical protein